MYKYRVIYLILGNCQYMPDSNTLFVHVRSVKNWKFQFHSGLRALHWCLETGWTAMFIYVCSGPQQTQSFSSYYGCTEISDKKRVFVRIRRKLVIQWADYFLSSFPLRLRIDGDFLLGQLELLGTDPPG